MQVSSKLEPSRFHGLDSLRSLAIIAVMVFHLQGYLPDALEPLKRVGWMGVDLFFVLSGFLIGTQLLRPYASGRPLSLGEFYIRRAYRILPAYLTVLLVYAAVPAWRETDGLAPVWQFLTFTWNLLLTTYPADRAFSHAWSLCVEEHFYLLLPALILWRMRRPSAAKTIALLMGLIAFGVAVRGWELFHVVRPAGDGWQLFMKRIYYPTYSRLDGLVLGVALAILKMFRPAWWARLARRGNLLLAAGVAIAALAIWLFRGGYPDSGETAAVLFGFPLLSAGFGLLVASCLCPGSVISRRIPGAAGLAALSYSLYLSHKMVAHVDQLVFPWLLGHSGWRAALVYAVSCTGVAWLLYAGVELPFLALRDRQARRAPGPSVAPLADPAL